MKKFTKQQLMEIEATFAASVLLLSSYDKAIQVLQTQLRTYDAIKDILFSKEYYELRLEELRIKNMMIKLSLDPSQFGQLNVARRRANEVEIQLRTVTAREALIKRDAVDLYLAEE